MSAPDPGAAATVARLLADWPPLTEAQLATIATAANLGSDPR